MVLYIELPEVLIWGEDDGYNFGHDGICGIDRTLRQTVQQALRNTELYPGAVEGFGHHELHQDESDLWNGK